jgi:hypothetical protein
VSSNNRVGRINGLQAANDALGSDPGDSILGAKKSYVYNKYVWLDPAHSDSPAGQNLATPDFGLDLARMLPKQKMHACARTFLWTVLQCRRMWTAVPKRLLQCGHWWSRRRSCTTLQCCTMLLFCAKRLLQWGYLGAPYVRANTAHGPPPMTKHTLQNGYSKKDVPTPT